MTGATNQRITAVAAATFQAVAGEKTRREFFFLRD
jgi:hypothetical protein